MKRSWDEIYLPADANKKRSKEISSSPFDYAPKTPHNPTVQCPTLDDIPSLELPSACSEKSARKKQSSLKEKLDKMDIQTTH